jgi:hypothetical protein
LAFSDLVVEVAVADIAQGDHVADRDGLAEHAQDVAGCVLVAEPGPQVRRSLVLGFGGDLRYPQSVEAFHVRRYANGKLIIKPSKAAVQSHNHSKPAYSTSPASTPPSHRDQIEHPRHTTES